MQIFAPGQRWINNAQLDKGLGTVLSSDARSVTLLFLATGETNIYSLQSAPLSRVKFAIGDTIISHDDLAILVTSVTEKDHLFSYIGKDETGKTVELEETLLNNFIQLNQPAERLFNDQIDDEKWFELRAQTLHHLNDLAHSDLRGLTGGRTSLIPHQLYIAHEVASRYAPRVLLADEVGLGKTIEAGMILHQQLITERAQRILIVVPESLLHQWLVEMLRRFNLMFHILDEERCADIMVSGEAENPFQSEQLILCSQEFLTRSTDHFQQCLASEWDLLVVDEAHHLVWSEQKPSVEYRVIEQLAAQTKGVLLLTATPEQLGKESHFARLRLLDPDRFPDFASFIEEEKNYEPIAHTVEQLIDQQVLDKKSLDTLHSFIGEGDNQENIKHLQNTEANETEKETARNALIEHLLDRHGTGRVLFRNTRSAVKGFPGRLAIPHALELPEEYALDSELSTKLYPELSVGTSWVAYDPRLLWLVDFIKNQGNKKTLVIAANAQTALDIADVLRIKEAIHAGVFHENMSLIERDRAAAFFANKQEGTPVLICSEIGSEGRNFQFAHQMVLFDLPLNPDLLEQRIGRLDRIGQTETIKIHIPYLKNTAQAVLFQWIHEGLQAFEHTCPAAHILFKQQKSKLLSALEAPDSTSNNLPALIESTQQLLKQHNAALQKGRNRLLEYNSCRPHLAAAIYQQAQQQDRDSKLAEYMDAIYDCYGINSEDDRENTLIIRPGDHMLTAFPGLPDDGMSITYDRDTALSNEDLHFLSWDHPLVRESLDLVVTSEMGNTSFTAIEHEDFQAGSILVEALYVLDASANQALQSHRYLPPTTLRLVVDESGEDSSDLLDEASIRSCRTQVDKKTAAQIVKLKRDDISDLIKRCETLAMQETPVVLTLAHQQSKQVLENEINRLIALQSVNPNIREEEINFFREQLSAINCALDAAHLRLDAVRVIVTT